MRSIRQKGPFHDRFMRWKLKNNIKNFRSERLIATLEGCIHRRLARKLVLWNNARYIPLQYNEDHATVLLCPKKHTMGVEKGYDETLGVPAEIEERLQLGDRGVVSTSAKPLMRK